MEATSGRTFGESGRAEEEVRRQERRLKASCEALSRSNRALESRLAELFFMHEFLRALTAHTRVDDVCSVIADGVSGIMGAQIAAVYLLDETRRAYALAASHGRAEDAFVRSIPAGVGGLLDCADSEGVAFDRTGAGNPDVGSSGLWLREAVDVHAQIAAPLHGEGGRFEGAVVIAYTHPRAFEHADRERLDVVARQSSLALQGAMLHEELERLSVTDRLTELYNHGYVKQRLEQEVQRARRFGHFLSVIMLDIDDFKTFNDRFGHPRGDLVLQDVSALVRESLREMDVAARYGGEEFVVVLPETDGAGALAVAERIRSSIASHLFTGDTEGDETTGRVTVSVGVASFPAHATTPEGLIDAADSAMYRGKRSGKDRVEIAAAR